MADELEEDEEPSENEEDEAELEMVEEEGGGEGGEDAEEMEEADEATKKEEKERAGEMVEEEGEEEVEPVRNWEEVKGNEEEIEKGTVENKGSGDGLLEEFTEGMVEEVKKDGIGEGEEGWTEETSGGIEIGEGEGRADRAGAVLGWFVMEEEEGEDEKEAWVREVCVDTRVEPPE